MTALKQSPTKEQETWAGGDTPAYKQVCWPRRPHGILRIEKDIVRAITAWIAPHWSDLPLNGRTFIAKLGRVADREMVVAQERNTAESKDYDEDRYWEKKFLHLVAVSGVAVVHPPLILTFDMPAAQAQSSIVGSRYGTWELRQEAIWYGHASLVQLALRRTTPGLVRIMLGHDDLSLPLNRTLDRRLLELMTCQACAWSNTPDDGMHWPLRRLAARVGRGGC
jgi:hypothetical protein